MKGLKRILIGLCVAVAMGAAPVAANAVVDSNAPDSNQTITVVQGDAVENNAVQNAPSQSVPGTPAPQGHKVPVTPIEGPTEGDTGGSDTAICNQDEHTEVQQCVAGQARSAISTNTPLRFNWSVLAAFAIADFVVLALAYRYESNKDKRNVYAHHCNGRFVVR